MTDTTFLANGHKRAALYARVSTAVQLDNTSPESQLTRCREYAQAHGYTIVTEKVEQISGAFVLARSEYNDILNMVADGQIDVIVADIPDRLGRGDVIAKCELLAQMNGAIVEYASPGRDTSTIEGLVQHSAEQMVSGIERVNIRRRTTQGRRDRASAGTVIATSFNVYGYRFERKFDAMGRKVSVEMVVYEPEARVVRLIFEWYVIDGLSCYAIGKRLTADRVPTPRAGSGNWNRSTLDRILGNETYAGKWYYSKNDTHYIDAADGVKTRTVQRDKSEWILVNVPAIITPEIYQAAQAEQKKRRGRGWKPTKYQYHGMFSGLNRAE